eukprot:9503462-Pyramimonas_sp.AAC.1
MRERHAFHRKTIETQETQGTLGAGRVLSWHGPQLWRKGAHRRQRRLAAQERAAGRPRPAPNPKRDGQPSCRGCR